MEEFNDSLLNCDLSDGGFVGTPFTWYIDGVWQRLDRILLSLEWYSSFPFVAIRHLPKYKSDYNAILCQFNNNILNLRLLLGSKIFGLNTIIFKYCEGILDLYTNSSGMSKLIEKLLRLKLTLKEWNKLEFGKIHTKIDKAHYDVEIAKNDFHINPTTANSINLKKMNAILSLTLSMKEYFWKQKSNLK
ncbi:hypothetical protein OROMI_001211 [Orobanche minor]